MPNIKNKTAPLKENYVIYVVKNEHQNKSM